MRLGGCFASFHEFLLPLPRLPFEEFLLHMSLIVFFFCSVHMGLNSRFWCFLVSFSICFLWSSLCLDMGLYVMVCNIIYRLG